MKAKFLHVIILSLTFFAAHTSFAQDGIVDDVLSYTNKFRKANRLPPLEMRSDLNDIAQKHTTDMAKGRTGFGHGGFSKREGQVKKLMPGAHQFGENVAYGSSTGKDVVEGWKNSSGHRKNMLGPYKYIGIGVARNKRGVLYYTQLFVD